MKVSDNIRHYVNAGIESEKGKLTRSALESYVKALSYLPLDLETTIQREVRPANKLLKTLKLLNLIQHRIQTICQDLGNEPLPQNPPGVNGVLQPSPRPAPPQVQAAAGAQPLPPRAPVPSSYPVVAANPMLQNLRAHIHALHEQIAALQAQRDSLGTPQYAPDMSVTEKERVFNETLQRYRAVTCALEAKRGQLKTLELRESALQNIDTRGSWEKALISRKKTAAQGTAKIPIVDNASGAATSADCMGAVTKLFLSPKFSKHFAQRSVAEGLETLIRDYRNLRTDCTHAELRNLAEQVKARAANLSASLTPSLISELLTDPDGAVAGRPARLTMGHCVAKVVNHKVYSEILAIAKPVYARVFGAEDVKYRETAARLRAMLASGADPSDPEGPLTKYVGVSPELARCAAQGFFPRAVTALESYTETDNPELMTRALADAMQDALVEARELSAAALAQAQAAAPPGGTAPREKDFHIEGNAEQLTQVFSLCMVLSARLRAPCSDAKLMEDFAPDEIFMDEQGVGLATFSTAAMRFETMLADAAPE